VCANTINATGLIIGTAGSTFSSSIQATSFNCTAGGGHAYYFNSVQVVGARGSAVTAPAATIADCQRAINDIISRLSSAAGHGLIT